MGVENETAGRSAKAVKRQQQGKGWIGGTRWWELVRKQRRQKGVGHCKSGEAGFRRQ